MKVTIDKTFKVSAPIDQVWVLLSDPNKVVGCVPGAGITETVDDRNYKGTVSMKVGPVVTNFKGDILIEVLDAERHKLVLKGDGVDAKGKGSASMTMTGDLKALDGGGTEVATSMEVSVIGRLAQFGARLMEDVSNRMFDQFVDCFEKKLAPSAVTEVSAAPGTPGSGESLAKAVSDEPAQPEPIKALPLFFSVLGGAIVRFFRRLLGGKSDS